MASFIPGTPIQNSITRDIIDRQMIDVNIYQENLFYTKMIIKNSALDHYLFGPGGDDYSAWSLRDIERRLKQEIAKTYGG